MFSDLKKKKKFNLKKNEDSKKFKIKKNPELIHLRVHKVPCQLSFESDNFHVKSISDLTKFQA